VLQGAMAFAAVAAIYLVALGRGMAEAEARALTFFSLVTTIVALIFVNRSFSASLLKALRRPNAVLAWCLFANAVLLGATLLWPVARGLFRFAPLSLGELSVVFGAGVVVMVLLEAIKHFWRDRGMPPLASHAAPRP
jgi:P-type Ca2+ transporter type 2C